MLISVMEMGLASLAPLIAQGYFRTVLEMPRILMIVYLRLLLKLRPEKARYTVTNESHECAIRMKKSLQIGKAY